MLVETKNILFSSIHSIIFQRRRFNSTKFFLSFLFISGATSGIGVETTRVLALQGVHVIMAIRNMGNGKKIKEKIVKSIPNAKIDFMELNLSSMESIRKFVKEFNSAGHPLNLLM